MTDLSKLPPLLHEYRKLAALRHPSSAQVARREQILEQLVQATGQYHPRVAVAEAEELARRSSSRLRTARARTTQGVPSSASRRIAGVQPASTCRFCGKPFTQGTVHKSCRPVACQGCGRTVPRSNLRKGRCPACVPPSTPGRPKVAGNTATGSPHQLTPFEQANRARQNAQRRTARRLAQLPRSAWPPESSHKNVECSMCGKNIDHQCGERWRLADGRIAPRASEANTTSVRRNLPGRSSRRHRGKGGSVWTVRGGLPGLGKRSR